MTIPASLVAAIEADAPLLALLHEDSQFVTRLTAVGLGPNAPYPPKPFIVLTELPSTVIPEVQETSNGRLRYFQLWAYDDLGDYTAIDKILARFREVAKAFAPLKTAEGDVCMESKVTEISGDLQDEPYQACAKYAIARLSCSA